MRVELGDPLLDLRVGHVLDVLGELPDASVHCCVTSPPYYALRDYESPEAEWPDGWVGQLGLEPTPERFTDHLVSVFTEVRRVLRDDGSLWLNLGDTYLDAELLGIPWKAAEALRASGWRLRSENIWRKMGGMPESVFTRTSRCHEHVFHFVKSPSYYYDTDAIREPYAKDNRKKTTVKAGPNSIQHRDGERWPHPDGRIKRTVWDIPTADYPGAHFAVFPDELPETCVLATTSERGCCPQCGAPWARIVEAEGETTVERAARQPQKWQGAESIAPRSDGGTMQQGVSVGLQRERRTLGWEPTCACKDESVTAIDGIHPPFEPVPCTVLDPFVGSGTTMVVARRHGRASVGIELSEVYAENETVKRLGMWWKDAYRPRELPEDQLSLLAV